VLIGPEKCKLLAWSDIAITCQVVKPLLAGEYILAVLVHGAKPSSEPLTSTFTMRSPHIIPAETPSGFIVDGSSVTILGDFFGDKRGDVVIGDRAALIVTAKVLDWSMHTIRFEIPRSLAGATGDFIVKVENEVGDALRFVHINSGMPEHYLNSAYISYESNDNASGISYKGKFYAFHTHSDCVFCTDFRRLKLQMVEFGGYGYDLLISGEVENWAPAIETDASVVPIIIGDKLWVFVTGLNDGLFYITYDGTSWETSWHSILDVKTNSNWEIAPVYNTVTHRIAVYHEYYSTLNWVYSDDYGATWHKGGQVTALGGGSVPVSTPPSAVFYKKSDTNYFTLLAVADSSKQGHVYDVKDGAVVAQRLSFGTVSGRPFIYAPVVAHNEFHMVWQQADNSDVYSKSMYKWNNDNWGPTEVGSCAELNHEKCWKSNWPVNLAAWSGTYNGWFEFQFWGYDGHWVLTVQGLPKQQ
jgi:hypothetical protein